MKNIFTFSRVLFVIILLVAIFFRFYQLASIPPAGSLDEVSIGWNAYSILLTGKGEYARPFPLIMQAYDDFRPAGYLYLVIPFIKLFGLQELSVRLPSALLSLATVVASYFFSKILLRKYKYEEWISLSVMALFAISPFHIYISRLGHEVNPGLTFAFLGIVLFLWGILSLRKWLLLGTGIFWAASFYTYQSEKVFVPLIIVTLLILFYKKVWEHKKIVILSLLTAFILSLPIVLASLQPGALLRLKGTSVFSDQHPYVESSLKLAQAVKNHDVVGQVVYNRRLVPIGIFIGNYLPHFNPQWWIGNSGLERFKAPGVGLSYVWELPFFLLGLIFLWRLPVSFSIKLLPIFWILVAFVAPGISTETPHAMRSFTILPIPQFLEAIGVVEMGLFLGKIKQFQRVFQAIFVIVVAICFVVGIKQFSYAYFVAFPQKESAPYQYALHRAIEYVLVHKEYNHVVISNQNNATQSYMFYLFESQYDPSKYQQTGGTGSGGFMEPHRIDRVDFTPFNKSVKLQKNTLYIVNVAEVPDNVVVVQQFAGLAKKVRLVAFIVKP